MTFVTPPGGEKPSAFGSAPEEINTIAALAANNIPVAFVIVFVVAN